ncbi:MAG: sugar ABC transporter permease [Treponemataceae bacterium]|nr:sugar ABC transporter permease [Treponemataceae bacterium]
MANMIKVKETLKKNTMLFALVVVVILFQVLITGADRGSLLNPMNVSNIISQNSYVLILATGMLLCILTGGNIDLSVGSVVALVGAVAGKMMVEHNSNIWLTIVVCIVLGTAIGAWQAFWIAYIRIPPFIVTLAGMLLWRGVALLILDGLTIAPFPENYLKMFTSFIPGGNADKSTVLMVTMIIAVIICVVMYIMQIANRIKRNRKGYETESLFSFIFKLVILTAVILYFSFLLGNHKGIPVVLILIAAIVIIYSYFTENTVPGRYFYTMGGNEKATRLSGINTDHVLFAAYTNMGFLSAVAALVCIARFNSAAPSAGTNYEMDAIGSCFIGGASAYGGTGTVGGAVIGAIFMGVLNNGMSILGIDSNWQKAVKGIVLLAAVIFDVLSKKRSRSN